MPVEMTVHRFGWRFQCLSPLLIWIVSWSVLVANSAIFLPREMQIFLVESHRNPIEIGHFPMLQQAISSTSVLLTSLEGISQVGNSAQVAAGRRSWVCDESLNIFGYKMILALETIYIYPNRPKLRSWLEWNQDKLARIGILNHECEPAIWGCYQTLCAINPVMRIWICYQDSDNVMVDHARYKLNRLLKM